MKSLQLIAAFIIGITLGATLQTQYGGIKESSPITLPEPITETNEELSEQFESTIADMDEMGEALESILKALTELTKDNKIKVTTK